MSELKQPVIPSGKGIASSRIYLQLGVYLLGIVLLIAIELIFTQLIEGLNREVENERSRLMIGEIIVNDLIGLQSSVYQMATTSNVRGQARIHDILHDHIDELKEALSVLENGGTIDRLTRINIESQESMRRSISYQPGIDSSEYSLEAIDLLPKLDELQEKTHNLIDILHERERLKELDNKKEDYINIIARINWELQSFSPLFVRASENANRLFFQGQKRLNKLEEEIQKEQENYRQWQTVLSLLVIVTVLLVGYLVLRQIQAANRQLQKLTNSLNFQKFAMDQHAIVSATDYDGDIIYANDKFCEISGYSREELIGKNHRFVNSGEHDDEFFRDMWDTIKGGEVWHGEVKNKTRDDSYYWVAATIVPLRDENGEITQFIAIRTDITPRKYIEEAFKESNHFLQSLTDTMGEGVYALNKDGECIFINPKASALLGWSKFDILGENIHDLIHFHDSEGKPVSADECPILQHIAKGKSFFSEDEIFIRKDGETFHVAVNAVPILQGEELQGQVVVFNDISLRKETEYAMALAKETAEQANEFKSVFLANMSHEIRTPMNAVINLSKLALLGELNESKREYIESVLSAGENLMGIINDILDFSKIEAGKMELEMVPFSLSELVNDAVNVVIYSAKVKNLPLHCDIPDELKVNFIGDPLRISQILTNLLNNAVKFTEKGEVVLDIKLINDNHSSKLIRFEVRDTGIGMAKEMQSKLLEPFQQADNSTTRKYGGTGLGLAICKQLLEMMGSGLELESKPGEYTTFSFNLELPTAENISSGADYLSTDAEERISEVSNKELSAIRGAHVLVVEDNIVNQKIAESMLLQVGLEVDIVDNGEEAIKQLESGRYDLVFMDLQMPVMDGYEATKQIRSNEAYAGLPIIAMTAHAMNIEREHCLAAGMNDHVAKPIDIQKLHTALVRWIKPGHH